MTDGGQPPPPPEAPRACSSTPTTRNLDLGAETSHLVPPTQVQAVSGLRGWPQHRRPQRGLAEEGARVWWLQNVLENQRVGASLTASETRV